MSWKKTEEGIVLTFSKALKVNKISGKVFLFRPSNTQLDFEIPIVLSSHNLLIPHEHLLDGRWNLKIDWQYKGKFYLYKEQITY